MGVDKIRHLLTKRLANGETAYYWNPSKTVLSLGLSPEALGTVETAAKARAVMLNQLADAARHSARQASNGPLPGTFGLLVLAFKASEEFGDLKPRTQRDYGYYLGKVEIDFGHLPVAALSPLVVKEYYKRIRREVSVTWAYHVMGAWRTCLTWGVSENWLDANPALDVRVKSPQKRTVQWAPEQAEAYIAKAVEMGWHSIAAMAHVFDSIGQSPIDVRTLKMGAYDGARIEVTRAKTGRTDAPILLFPAARNALDAYLATQTAKLPDAPLFTNDQIGGEWNESTLGKTHRKIRAAAGLPAYLQLQDFRTTAQTEGGAAGGTVDELRGLGRHATRSAGEHYVHPDARFVDSIQAKRLEHRNKVGQKIRTAKS